MRIGLFILYFVLVVAAWGQPAGNVRFEAVDIYVDAGGRELAAYQVEFRSASRGVKITGVEGGDRPFGEPPHYDPRAMQKERVVIAAFTTDTPPSGKIRVATIHLRVAGQERPDYRVKLVTAGDRGGAKIAAETFLRKRS